MTLNGVIAFIFLYFTEFDSFAGLLLQWLPIVSAEYRLPRLAKTDPPCSAVSLRQLSYLYYVQTSRSTRDVFTSPTVADWIALSANRCTISIHVTGRQIQHGRKRLYLVNATCRP